MVGGSPKASLLLEEVYRSQNSAKYCSDLKLEENVCFWKLGNDTFFSFAPSHWYASKAALPSLCVSETTLVLPAGTAVFLLHSLH